LSDAQTDEAMMYKIIIHEDGKVELKGEWVRAFITAYGRPYKPSRVFIDANGVTVVPKTIKIFK
jgi:hypothetical protein